MKNIKSLFLAVLMVLSLCLVGCDGLRKDDNKSQVSDVPSLKIGDKAPDFELVAQDGSKLTLADLKGKKVYINVWGSWCGPCLMEMPELEEVYQEVKKQEDWVFLSVASANDEALANSQTRDASMEEIQSVANETGVTYPVYFEQNNQFMTDYLIRAFPTHIFINSDGTIANYGMGALNKTVVKNTLQQVK